MKEIFTLFLLFTTSFLVFAQQHDSNIDTANEHIIHKTHSDHNNHIAMFAGVTSKLEHNDNSLTLGFDYVYFIPNHKHFGISVFTEAIIGEYTEWLIGLPVIYRANEHVWMRSGLGVEFVVNEDEKLEIHEELLVRVGAGYDFKIGEIVLSPSLDIDIVRKHASLVAGLNIGYGF